MRYMKVWLAYMPHNIHHGVPLLTPFVIGRCYYIMFVDDYTHVSWVYLLCDRSKVVITVTHFLTEVIT